jgi:phosphate transport system substrate-binding protein
VLHARDANSGTWETFRTLVLGSAELRSGARRHESTAELAQAVASDRGAIGFVGLAGIGETRALAISDGGAAMPPTRLGVAVEDYPLARRLYLYRPEPASALAQDFLDFALSPAGQVVVERSGFVPQQVRGYNAPPRQDVGDEYRALVDGADRLSLNFRFDTGSSLLDSKALRDLDRLGAFMRQPDHRGRSLILLGFADANEISPYQALALSNDRADFIASCLEERGIAVRRVRGLGGSAPVASNDSHAGRHRNRRVEVWLGSEASGASGSR